MTTHMRKYHDIVVIFIRKYNLLEKTYYNRIDLFLYVRILKSTLIEYQPILALIETSEYKKSLRAIFALNFVCFFRLR